MPTKTNNPKRIVFIGAECTGKTTLAKEIARRVDEPCSSEYVRQYADSLDRPLAKHDLEAIARGQIALEDEALQTARRFALHDTNLLSSILYAEHYFDTHIPWVDKAFLERSYSQYFLCLPDLPWEEDPGQRVGPEERDQLHTLFQEILARYEIRPIPLSGSLDERIQIITTELNKCH